MFLALATLAGLIGSFTALANADTYTATTSHSTAVLVSNCQLTLQGFQILNGTLDAFSAVNGAEPTLADSNPGLIPESTVQQTLSADVVPATVRIYS